VCVCATNPYALLAHVLVINRYAVLVGMCGHCEHCIVGLFCLQYTLLLYVVVGFKLECLT